MKVLITGFDPFGGEPINPAYEAIKMMKGNPKLCDLVKLEVPTVFGKSLETIGEAVEKERPDVVICVGQAGGRFDISVERVGINLDEARIPDNEGNFHQGKSIVEGGENAYFSTLPNRAIVKELKENRIPASVSYSAGTFVCNHVLYGLMHLIKTKYPDMRGGFIHVPFLPEQVMDKRNVPSMSLEMICRGLELAVKASVENTEDINYVSGETH